MKRFSLIFLGALAILIASCSKENPSFPNEEAWVHDLSLPVPIKFGNEFSHDLVTKVGFEKLEDFTSDMRFGVFGVDTDSTDWSKGKSGVLLYNAVAQYSDGYMGFRESGKVVEYYYPMDVSCNYTFYAYYTLDSNASVGEEDKTGYYTTVNFGSTDVLWAKTFVSEDMQKEIGKNGFNAAYCRAVKSKFSTSPENLEKHMTLFKFEHLTTALDFSAIADGDEADFEKVLIKAIRVTDAIKTARLCVANKDPEKEKKWDELSEKGVVSMSGIGTGIKPLEGDGAKVGNGLFLYPAEKFTIEVDIEAPQNGTTKITTLRRTVSANGNFEANCKYHFQILVKSPEELSIKVNASEFTDKTATVTDGNVLDETHVAP